jgi:putative ABC transport system permease protein
MTPATFVWANLRRRPLHNLLGLASVTLAFALYGLAMGVAEGFRRAAIAHHAAMDRQFLLGAMAVSGIGMALILFLTANAMAHTIRLRLYEFGVLKALGFSHHRIIALVVAETALPCLAGAILGMVGARLLFMVLVALAPPLAAFPSPVYTPVIVAAGIAVVLLIAMLSAVIPASRIARLDAAVALAGDVKAPAPNNAPSRLEAPVISQPFRTTDIYSAAKADLRLLRQVFVATRIGFSTLRLRIKGALMITVGVGCVVFVLLSIVSIGEGLRIAIQGSSNRDRVILHGVPAGVVMRRWWLHKSILPDDVTEIAAAAPGVARAADGTPLAEAEIVGVADQLRKRNDGEMGNTTIVGVGPRWREIASSFRLLGGRMPRPGSRELIAGYLARQKFSGLDGNRLNYKGVSWRIVGTFTTGGWWDGYLIGDVGALRPYGKHPSGSIVLVRLVSPNDFEAFRRTVARRIPPSIIMERESDYYAEVWQSAPRILFYCAYLISGLIAAGAFAGTVQIMHGALEERNRETATLRALGFDSRAVAASVVLEAVLLALLGALIGAALVWLWRDGFLYNAAWDVFRVTVDLYLVLMAMAWALTIALAGTLPLAIRTVRESEIHALQNL